MYEELLIRHCSPTLAGLKTGSLFACSFPNEYEMKKCIRCWNRTLTKKGLRVLPLRFQNSRALIYVYRPALLSKDLQHDIAERLLQERGYCTKTSERCVMHLIKRLCEYEEFPHEIGLFLGYPPEDVHGFIENKADGYKCVGCWKVYGDAESAQSMFEACEAKLSGKKIALFGSYGWGDGEWMRNWEENCKNAGAVMACDFVICNEAPDDEAVTACKALGTSLA